MTARAELQPTPVHEASRAPDFFVVGQFKSGTTAIYEMLRRHPQIYLPEMKEVWFHSPELRARALARATNKRPVTLEDYLSLFADADDGQRIGEATPSYLISRGAARSIAELQPQARIIAILREPASFLRSFHLQCVENHTESEPDLRKALALVEQRREGKQIPRDAVRPLELLYTDHVRYVEQLQRYYEVFAPEQILVLIYEDFRRDNEAVLKQIMRFIGVDDTRPVEPVTANRTVEVRSLWLHEFVRSVYLGRGPAAGAIKRAIKAVAPRRVRQSALRTTRRKVIYASSGEADEALMHELRERFRGEVVALGEYMNRDLVKLWGYDAAG
jgi:hypothetical protein